MQVGALLGDDAALLGQCLADGDAGLLAGHAVEAGAGVADAAGLVHDRGHVEVVAQAEGVVVGVVRRGDLHGAGAELGVDVVVGDDDEGEVVAEGVRQGPADEVGVAGVVRVDGDGDVAEHRLHAGGGDDDVRLGVIHRAVAEGHQLALDVLVHDLDVGDGGLEHRGPVDQAVRTVDEPAVVELLEDGLHGAGQALVEGEALAGPVDGVTDGAHLVGDGAAVLLLPLPHLGDELLTAVVVAVLALGLLEHRLDLGLGRDTRVVHARQPQHLVALHALAARERVHESVVERVAHVELAGDVRRREDDGVRRLVASRVGREMSGVDPALVQPGLHRLRIPGLRQCVCSVLTHQFSFPLVWSVTRTIIAPAARALTLT